MSPLSSVTGNPGPNPITIVIHVCATLFATLFFAQPLHPTTAPPSKSVTKIIASPTSPSETFHEGSPSSIYGLSFVLLVLGFALGNAQAVPRLRMPVRQVKFEQQLLPPTATAGTTTTITITRILLAQRRVQSGLPRLIARLLTRHRPIILRVVDSTLHLPIVQDVILHVAADLLQLKASVSGLSHTIRLIDREYGSLLRLVVGSLVVLLIIYEFRRVEITSTMSTEFDSVHVDDTLLTDTAQSIFDVVQPLDDAGPENEELDVCDPIGIKLPFAECDLIFEHHPYNTLDGLLGTICDHAQPDDTLRATNDDNNPVETEATTSPFAGSDGPPCTEQLLDPHDVDTDSIAVDPALSRQSNLPSRTPIRAFTTFDEFASSFGFEGALDASKPVSPLPSRLSRLLPSNSPGGLLNTVQAESAVSLSDIGTPLPFDGVDLPLEDYILLPFSHVDWPLTEIETRLIPVSSQLLPRESAIDTIEIHTLLPFYNVESDLMLLDDSTSERLASDDAPEYPDIAFSAPFLLPPSVIEIGLETEQDLQEEPDLQGDRLFQAVTGLEAATDSDASIGNNFSDDIVEVEEIAVPTGSHPIRLSTVLAMSNDVCIRAFTPLEKFMDFFEFEQNSDVMKPVKPLPPNLIRLLPACSSRPSTPDPYSDLNMPPPTPTTPYKRWLEGAQSSPFIASPFNFPSTPTPLDDHLSVIEIPSPTSSEEGSPSPGESPAAIRARRLNRRWEKLMEKRRQAEARNNVPRLRLIDDSIDSSEGDSHIESEISFVDPHASPCSKGGRTRVTNALLHPNESQVRWVPLDLLSPSDPRRMRPRKRRRKDVLVGEGEDDTYGAVGIAMD
ncbi:hypothetical protein H0H93_006464 [Arthromyces matolae]|nr:hypothetical protein H0H93_006464 [Arthromyces matolae]